MRFKKLIYKNFFGEHNILITISDDGKTPHRDTLMPDMEIYNSHIWIHDNIVKKNHTGKEIFILDSIVSDDELKSVLGNVL
tara:strand:+ start:1034 stop:1276 length:243 start_codon:yes stop_codon:yes gene_type:complete